MAQCDFCFRVKSPLQPAYKGLSGEVCKACSYKIESVVGFLHHYGATITVQPALITPLPPRKDRKAPKSKSNPLDEGVPTPNTD